MKGMKNFSKRIVSMFLALCLFIGGPNLIQADAATVYVDRLADVVFVIDGTGSMQDDIDGVKENLSEFINSLRQEGVKVRVRFSVYRDATQTGQETQVSGWFETINSAGAIDVGALNNAIKFLEDITASGGPKETILNGYGKVLLENPEFRPKAAKFVIALTDENYYIDENDTDNTEAKIIEAIAKNSINSSIVTRGNLFPVYSKFRSQPYADNGKDGGILADIDGDYGLLLKELGDKIDYIIDDTQAVKIGANMIVLKKRPGQTFSITKDGITTTQDSCVFKDLEPDTEYEFTVTDPNAGDKTFTVRTEKVTGAQMGKIPSIVYEGETYQIRPNENMKTMLATPEATIHWSSVSDCLKITDNEVGNGCEMKVYDCKYNENRLIAVTLVADIEYTVWQKNGTYKKKSARVRQKFNIKNDIDAMSITSFHGTTDNVYQDGVIKLLTKEKVWMDIEFNQGDTGDVASKQKLKYFISDKYGNPNPMGRKIATVNGRGQLSGVAPGLTYLTIASVDSYNKYSKIYGYFATIPIVCPSVSDVTFEMDKAITEKPTVIKKQLGEDEVYAVKKGESLDLKEYVNYDPADVFNVDKMKCVWSSTNKTVASVSSIGQIAFKNEGYATILLSPIGGYSTDSVTGKKTGGMQPCSITFKVVEDIK